MNILPENLKSPGNIVYPNISREDHPQKQVLYMRRALQVLFKYKHSILAISMSIFILIIIATFLLPPTYRAQATIIIERHVETEKSVLLGIDSQQIRDLKDWLISEINILQSNPVLERVVNKLNLTSLVSDSTESPEKQKLKAIEFIRQRLIIENPRKSNVVNLQFEYCDPALAAKLINEIVANYQKYRNEVYSESSSYNFFVKQIHDAENELIAKESELAQFKKEHGIVSPSAQTEIVLRKLSEYEQSLTRTRTKRIGKQAKLDIIRKNLRDGKLINIPVLENTETPNRYMYWARIRLELLHLEMQRDSLLIKYMPEFQGVKNLNAQIQTTKEKMYNEVNQILHEENGRIEALKAEEFALSRDIKEIEGNLAGLSEKEIKFAELKRQIENKRDIYSLLLKQRDEAGLSLAKGLHGIAVRNVSAATIPVEPVKPVKKWNLILGFFLALFTALGITLLREFFDNSIDTPEKVERYIGVPVLATITDCTVTAK